MEIRQVRYFVMVAQTGSFSQAAKELFISQSTLSQQIQQLENEVGVKLLERNTRKVTLSEYGQEFLPYAKNLIYDAEACLGSIMDVRNMATGKLVIGVTYTFSSVMVDVLKEFIRDYPGIRLSIRTALMEELMDMLERNEIDLALSYDPGHKYDNIESTELFRSSICVIARDTHPLAQKVSISLEELSRLKLALPVSGMQARDKFDSVLAEKGIKMNIAVEVNDMQILQKLVRDTELVTVFSRNAIKNSVGLKALEIENIQGETVGCCHTIKGRYKSIAAREFIRRLRESYYFSNALEKAADVAQRL
ncbi:MAG: LysR family transcriptional regulator [Candidatus Cryptobacteroides sp.]|nr:LysR substrate-binding domain-containing protein [Bacteroidales bacterium]